MAWPSGLGKGLQSPVRGFDSRRHLQPKTVVKVQVRTGFRSDHQYPSVTAGHPLKPLVSLPSCSPGLEQEDDMGFIEKRNGRYRARYRDLIGRQRCETFTRKADSDSRHRHVRGVGAAPERRSGLPEQPRYALRREAGRAPRRPPGDWPVEPAGVERRRLRDSPTRVIKRRFGAACPDRFAQVCRSIGADRSTARRCPSFS